MSMALLYNGLYGQISDSLSLSYCLRMAGEKSPLTGQKSLSSKAMEYKVKNLASNWFPAVGFNGQATYSSETVHFADYMQGLPVSIPSLPLDQYKVWADINQQIFDGAWSGHRSQLKECPMKLICSGWKLNYWV